MKIKVRVIKVSAKYAVARENAVTKENDFVVESCEKTFYNVSARKALNLVVNNIRDTNSIVLEANAETFTKTYYIASETIVRYGEEVVTNET